MKDLFIFIAKVHNEIKKHNVHTNTIHNQKTQLKYTMKLIVIISYKYKRLNMLYYNRQPLVNFLKKCIL